MVISLFPKGRTASHPKPLFWLRMQKCQIVPHGDGSVSFLYKRPAEVSDAYLRATASYGLVLVRTETPLPEWTALCGNFTRNKS